MAKNSFKRKRYFLVTSKDTDEPNLGVVGIEIATADSETLIDPEKAEDTLKTLLRERLDSDIELCNHINFSQYGNHTTVTAKVTIIPEGGAYEGCTDIYDINLTEIWVLG